jgi:NTP pyrophosphatase (non-canonical NTP hydrolase)
MMYEGQKSQVGNGTRRPGAPSVLADLAKQCQEDSERWFGDSPIAASIPHHTLALAGEVGELANIVKKIERGSLDLGDGKVRYEIVMELADIFTYLMNLCGLLHIDMMPAYFEKRRVNEERFTRQRGERETRNG